MPDLRAVRDHTEADDSPAVDRNGQGALAGARLSAVDSSILALRGACDAVRWRTGEILGDAGSAILQSQLGANGKESRAPVPRSCPSRGTERRSIRRLHGERQVRLAHRIQPPRGR